MELLQQSAPAAVQALLLDLIGKAAQCAGRLTDDADSEALHDFRVALRRLNTHQRAYRDVLDIKLGKGVRRLARATNAARDREVQLQWLRLQRKDCDTSVSGELDALIDALQSALATERASDYPRWQEKYLVLAAKLRRRLAEPLTNASASPGFAAVAAAQLQRLADKLERDFATIARHGDDAAVHAARILGKRLRYLLEPLADVVPGVAPLLKRLKRLQDLLGDIHDCQVRLDDFAGRQEPDRAEQYAVLQRDTDARRARLLAKFQNRWLGEHSDSLFLPLRRVIARLTSVSTE